MGHDEHADRSLGELIAERDQLVEEIKRRKKDAVRRFNEQLSKLQDVVREMGAEHGGYTETRSGPSTHLKFDQHHVIVTFTYGLDGLEGVLSLRHSPTEAQWSFTGALPDAGTLWVVMREMLDLPQ